jgi:hypothetical protein
VSNNGPLAEPGSASSSDPLPVASVALNHMEQALELLDQLDGTTDGADAHLDMAIHRLRDWMSSLDD